VRRLLREKTLLCGERVCLTRVSVLYLMQGRELEIIGSIVPLIVGALLLVVRPE
jgi:hypothetical protein